MSTHTLITAAMDYAARGLEVVPYFEPQAGGCSCRRGRICADAGKHPRTKNGFNDATIDPAKIKRWWGQWPRASVGIKSGAASGIVVLDIDPTHGGFDSLAMLVRGFGPLPETPTSRTGSGGEHYLFRHPGPGWRVKSTQGAIAPGIDVRADGAAFVAPPSLHRSGNRYSWTVPIDDVELAELPEFIPKESDPDFTETSRELQKPFSVTLCPALSLSVKSADDAVAATLPAREGERNSCLLKLARALKFNLDITDLSEASTIVRQWHQRALPFVTTKEIEFTLIDFDRAFRNARHPFGVDLVGQAAASVDPGELPEAATRYDGQTMRQLVSMVYELSKLSGGRFFLSCHDAAARLGISPMRVWQLLRLLEADGVIACMERGNERRATRYRWIGGGK